MHVSLSLNFRHHDNRRREPRVLQGDERDVPVRHHRGHRRRALRPAQEDRAQGPAHHRDKPKEVEKQFLTVLKLF